MTRPAELESRGSSGAPELLNLDYRAHFQHISRRRHMQVRGEFSHMGCPWAVRAAVRPLRSDRERTPARPASGGGGRTALPAGRLEGHGGPAADNHRTPKLSCMMRT